jgi:antagonist of KipI
MSVIRVLEPGLFSTVQDLGREGFGALGVSPSGAADAVSLRIGNLLLGNTEGAPGLEMTLVGGAFVFPEGATIALAGSDFGAALDGIPVEMWTAVEARPGQTLRLGATRSGARCYLCVRGGIAVKLFLGSASTHVLSGLGGFEGRALRKGDQLPVGGEDSRHRTGESRHSGAPVPGKARRLSTRGRNLVAARSVLRATAGPQSEWFDEAALRDFYAGRYRVTEASNRLGLRLEGAPAAARGGAQMISEGVALGAVQVPEAGQPIILFVEQQTTGGYPKIANVIAADFQCLGQLRPRDEVRFALVTWETARELLHEQETVLGSKELLFV